MWDVRATSWWTIPRIEAKQNFAALFKKKAISQRLLMKKSVLRFECQNNCKSIQQFCIIYEHLSTKILATCNVINFFLKYVLSTVKHLLHCTQTFNKRSKSRLGIHLSFYKIKLIAGKQKK
jgi:hypothetical protein